MMNLSQKALFSSDGEYLAAFANEPGSLRIWESVSNTLKQDNILLSSRFSCSTLIWGPWVNELINFSDREDAPDSGTEISDCQSLVIGTDKGEILLYDFTIGKFHNHFVRAHTDVVTDLCWHKETGCLYSCSKDKAISIWDVFAGKIKSKWEADDEPLQSICVIDSDNLLSASTAVSWWNLKDQTIIKRFGHLGSDILTLLPVISTDASSYSYFLTVAAKESKISAWHLSKTNRKTAMASFNLSDELKSIDVTRNFSKKNPMLLSAVVKTGHLVIYQHVLNGRIQKNLSPLMTVHIVTKPTMASKPCTIPIIASKFSNDFESCIVAYGNLDNPLFERIKIKNCPKKLTLVRDVVLPPQKLDTVSEEVLYSDTGENQSLNGQLPVSLIQSSPKSKRHTEPVSPLKKQPAKNIQEAPKTHSPVRKTNSSPSVKKKQRKSEQIISPDSTQNPSNHSLILSDASSIVDCLLRGLETENSTEISMVLQCDNDELIRNSVLNIPLHKLKYLLLELHKRLTSQEERYNSRKWLKILLKVHLRYISQNKDLLDALEPTRVYLEKLNVSKMLSRMSVLKGLLNIQRIQNTPFEDSSCSDTDQHMET